MISVEQTSKNCYEDIFERQSTGMIITFIFKYP